MQKNLPEIMTAGDLQHFLNISRGKAYKLFNEKGFPTLIIGGNKRVKRDDFLVWLDSQKQ